MSLSSLRFSSLVQGLRRRFFWDMPRPEAPLCVIGDIHGCLTQLQQMLAQVPAGYRIILLGDYVDRGPESAAVLRFLQAREDITCLKGNHEEMLLRFLQDPEEAGPQWLRHGGLETLRSFGLQEVHAQMEAGALCACRDQLRAAMGEDLIRWLAARPVSLLSGTVLLVHAGADPRRSPEDQPEAVLLWGHREFQGQRRRDGIWVVHGHTVVGAPEVRAGRIAIDTGAYATGRLSAICLDGGPLRFLNVQI
ncbi:metallophosphoesterase family protein [Roseobacter sp. SK209-2-6]|uniref:metallophosphoesterase family protein n=1 Tax=Roseobacter sp. SK209-2-6 TaxID=388739 RepID=UPI001E3852E1|nr:metallophosphoesterase family protein [Roseobacter sp. SK209-2-6]